MKEIHVKQGSVERNPNILVRKQCSEAQGFIDSGDYSSAREALSDVWRRVGERPDLQWLDASTSAEVLLRVGVLTGWIGSSQTIAEAQEFAKDLISEAVERFQSLADESKVAEAQIDLSICYWREGAFAEARVVVDDALSKATDLLRARALVNKSTIEVSCVQLREALDCLEEAEPLLATCQDHALLGRFHNQRALILRGMSENKPEYTDRSLIEYEAASSHFELAGDARYQGAVETNLGYAYFALGRHGDALAHLDHAKSLFTRIKSRTHIAQTDEARAQVFLSQGNNVEAEHAARNAVMVLCEGDEAALLAEATTTHGVALARLGKYNEARGAFLRAVSAAERAGDLAGAGKAYLAVMEELSEYISASDLLSCYTKADGVFAKEVSPAITQRLRNCVRRIMEPKRELAVLEPGHTLHSAVLIFEKELVRRALIVSKGRITTAARLLGITHQGLAFILSNRHQDLLELRKEKRTRRRSIITKKVVKRVQRKAANA